MTTMATLNFTKFFLVAYLACGATAAPCEQNVNIFANGRRILVRNLSECSTSVLMINGEQITVPPLSRALRFLNHVKRRSTAAIDEDTQGRSASIEALKETGKLIQMAAMLPPETLQVVRMIAVPLLNQTLAVPANILEGAAKMSLGKELTAMKAHARSSGNHLWQLLAHLKLKPRHHFLFHKNLTLGPLSLNKIVEFGAPNHLPATTPPPAILPETTPAPVVMAVTTPPPEILAVTTPPPAVPEPPKKCPLAAVAPPPVAVVAATPAPPVEVPATPAPPVEVPATPAPLVEVPATPAPACGAPVVLNPTVVVPVAVPQPTDGGSTTQIAVVQHTPPADSNPEASH